VHTGKPIPLPHKNLKTTLLVNFEVYINKNVGLAKEKFYPYKAVLALLNLDF